MPEAQELMALLERLARAPSTADARAAIWHKMLALYTDQVFSIGMVNGTLQPIVRRTHAAGTFPTTALYGFDPTRYFGVYMPDTFFFDDGAA